MFQFSKIKVLTLFLLFSIGILVFVVGPAQALNLYDSQKTAESIAGQAGYNKDAKDINVLIGQIITATLSFLGVIFLALMVYGGYLWMTDRGNEEQVKRAKNLISAAIIGLVIIVAAYAISWFVISKLTATTLTET